jgi:hypothetical protein
VASAVIAPWTASELVSPVSTRCRTARAVLRGDRQQCAGEQLSATLGAVDRAERDRTAAPHQGRIMPRDCVRSANPREDCTAERSSRGTPDYHGVGGDRTSAKASPNNAAVALRYPTGSFQPPARKCSAPRTASDSIAPTRTASPTPRRGPHASPRWIGSVSSGNSPARHRARYEHRPRVRLQADAQTAERSDHPAKAHAASARRGATRVLRQPARRVRTARRALPPDPNGAALTHRPTTAIMSSTSATQNGATASAPAASLRGGYREASWLAALVRDGGDAYHCLRCALQKPSVAALALTMPAPVHDLRTGHRPDADSPPA